MGLLKGTFQFSEVLLTTCVTRIPRHECFWKVACNINPGRVVHLPVTNPKGLTDW